MNISEINESVTGLLEEMVGKKMSKFDPAVLVEHIDTFGKGLSEWEIKFIADLLDNPPEEYSTNQIKIINRIYDQKC